MTSFTAEQLQRLLRPALARVGISAPSLAECAELVIWSGHGPVGDIARPTLLSDRPRQCLVALRGALAEAETYWEHVTASYRPDVFGERPESASEATAQIHETLAALRDSMNAAEPLLTPVPQPFKDSWGAAARGLERIFVWIEERGGANKLSGLSKGGPKMDFICSGLRELGWTFTEDAVRQYLRRTQGEWDNSA